MSVTALQKKATESMNTGISDAARRSITKALSSLLADTYLLALKTQNYHWNVTGPHFQQLHELFGAQYVQLAAAIDIVAERIRALGGKAPGSFREFSELSSLSEDKKDPRDWKAMVANLVADHEAAAKASRALSSKAAEAHDEVTVDMLAARMEEHEKTAWMLRSHLA